MVLAHTATSGAWATLVNEEDRRAKAGRSHRPQAADETPIVVNARGCALRVAIPGRERKFPQSARQQLVLGFLRALRCKHAAAASPPARCGANAALEMIDGLLVFTGALEAPNLDWVKVVRDERDEGFVHQALGRNERR